MKQAKRSLSLLLSFVLLLSLFSVPGLAAARDDSKKQVRVIVENTTYPKSEGAPWDGTLVDEWVEIDSSSTMMSCVTAALTEKGYSQEGAESNYISEINGLAAFAGGGMSGWMGTLNDWFTNEGFGEFTVSNGKLKAGDEIRIVYTCDFGPDVGGTWDTTDKTLKALAVSDGSIYPAFNPDTHAYTLTLGEAVSAVTVTPTATNKNYQVRTFVGDKEYSRTAAIPVSDGTVITVKCGDKSWPTMNDNTGDAQVYTLTVSGGAPAAPTYGVTLTTVPDTVSLSLYRNAACTQAVSLSGASGTYSACLPGRITTGARTTALTLAAGN